MMDREARWRTVVTVCIAVASLLGALATWRLTQVAGAAGGADARAVDDTITREQNRSRALVIARGEATAFARVIGYERAADSLEALADGADAAGQGATAQVLRTTRQTLHDLAVDLLQRYRALRDPRYVKDDGATFDVQRRRVDIELTIERSEGVFPSPEAAEAAAVDAHGDAKDIGLVILAFAIAIFVLALAEKWRDELDVRLSALGTSILAIATVALVVVW